MSIHDYPQNHLMSHIRKVIFLEEKTNRNKLQKFLTDKNFLQCLPLNLDTEMTELIIAVRNTIKNSEDDNLIDEIIFSIVIVLNMYAIEKPYKFTLNFIKGIYNKFMMGEGWEPKGFTMDHLQNHKSNLKRYEIINAFNTGKTVTFKGNVLHRLNESYRKVDTETVEGLLVWNLALNYDDIKIYDPTSPEITHRTQIVLKALKQGKRVKVNNHELIPVIGLADCFHWQDPNCIRYRTLAKIVYTDFTIEVY